MPDRSSSELEEALQKCASEPIHQLGAVQPQGAIIVFGRDVQRSVLQVSTNLQDFIDLPEGGACGRPLAEVLGERAANLVDRLIGGTDTNHPTTATFPFRKLGEFADLDLRLFVSGPLFGLELTRSPIDTDRANQFGSIRVMQRALLKLDDNYDFHAYVNGLAEITRELTGFDRVMIYRFDANWDGDVIAESKSGGAKSYLNFHFPASDIPEQARSLYTKNRVRMYADVDSKPVPILPSINPSTHQPVDLTNSLLRSFSPVHIEYLRNMGVRASMSISLLQNGRLWGLVACHHMSPLELPNRLTEAAELISQVASSRLAYIERENRQNLGDQIISIIGEALRYINNEEAIIVLRRLTPQLLRAFNADGLIVVADGDAHILGSVPDENEVSALLRWLGQLPPADYFCCENLSRDFPPAAEYREVASGLLAAPVSVDMKNCMIWLRPERLRKVSWGGNPEKKLVDDADGSLRLSPRESFDAWIENWRGHSTAWSLSEVEIALILSRALTEGVSQKKRLEMLSANERESEERFRKLFEDTYQPTMLIEDGRIVAVNRSALRVLRAQNPQQILNHSLVDISPRIQADGQTSQAKFADVMQSAFNQGAVEFEWDYLPFDGELLTTMMLITAIIQNGREALHVVWYDITKKRRALQRLEYLAYNDNLTGLRNWEWFNEQIANELTMKRRLRSGLAVMQLDIDNFKYVNDTHGHDIGDHLLKKVALRIGSLLHGDGELARLSGDEFGVLLSGVQANAEVASICERVFESLRDSFDIDGVQLFVTVSIGISSYPQDGVNGADLMRHADIALQEAKKDRQNSYRFFEPRMNEYLKHYVETRDALRIAMEQMDFELYYQPQLKLSSGVLIGAEALIRWKRQGRGIVSPGDFIGVAEESGLIVPIGRWVLHEACRQARAWNATGLRPLVVAVNISAVQFREGHIEHDIETALESSGLDPSLLELEITETLLLQGADEIGRLLDRIRQKGVRLSIDDFGTGYSSLTYLKRFRVDKLKIDQSFVSGLLSDQGDQAIVKAVIEIAKSLQIITIAEGVETDAQARLLTDMGCDEVQGYLYSKPLASSDFEHWVETLR